MISYGGCTLKHRDMDWNLKLDPYLFSKCRTFALRHFSITARLRGPTEATQNPKPPKLHFIDLPSMRQMKAETEIRLLHEFQANVSNRFFQNQDSSFYPRKRRLSEKLYKSKCL